MVPFSLRAAACTALVMTLFGAGLSIQLQGVSLWAADEARDGLLPLNAGSRGDPDEQQAIVTAALTEEARLAGGAPACLRLADEGDALNAEREWLSRLRRAASAVGPQERGSLLAQIERTASPARNWLVPPPLGAAPQAAILPENARQLADTETALLSQPAARSTDLMLDMAALPDSLRGGTDRCPALTFSAPDTLGNVAFVETRREAASGRTSGWLIALVRTGGSWQVEALARL